MAAQGSRDRKRLVLLAGLLLLGAAGWLLLAGDDDGSSRSYDEAERAGGRAPADLLGAEAPPGEADEGPALATREPGEAPAARGPVTVRALGLLDAPLPGVTVELVATPDAPKTGVSVLASGETDARGAVRFPDQPYDGSVSARLSGSRGGTAHTFRVDRSGDVQVVVAVPPTRIVPRYGAVAVSGPVAIVRAEEGIPWRLDVVAADTGKLLRGVTWSAHPRFATASPDGMTASGESALLAAGTGRTVKTNLAFGGIPSGFLAFDAPSMAFRVHPMARRLVARHPLRPEARIAVAHEEARDLPPRASWQARCRIDGIELESVGARPDAQGRWWLHGVPHLPGGFLQADGALGRYVVRGDGRLPEDAGDVLFVQAALLPLTFETARITIATEPIVVTGTLGGGVVLRPNVVSGPLIHFVQDKSARSGVPPPRPLEVLVLRADGSPAPGAEVTIGKATETADAKGIARFGNVQPGEAVLKVWGAGASFVRSVAVPAGENARVRVQGPGFGALKVYVEDEDGVPLPYARLEVKQPSGLPWCDLNLGEQRVDPYTDHRGERSLGNLELGEVAIKARFGGRSASVKEVVFAYDYGAVRIVIPKLPPAAEKTPEKK